MLATLDYNHPPRNVDPLLLCDYGADPNECHRSDDDNTSTSVSSFLDYYANSGRTQLVCFLILLAFNARAIGSGSSSQLTAFFAMCLSLFSILSAKISTMEPQTRQSDDDITKDKKRWQCLAVFFILLSALESVSVLCHHMGYLFQDSMEVGLMIMMVLASAMLLGFWVRPRLSRAGNNSDEYIITL